MYATRDVGSLEEWKWKVALEHSDRPFEITSSMARSLAGNRGAPSAPPGISSTTPIKAGLDPLSLTQANGPDLTFLGVSPLLKFHLFLLAATPFKTLGKTQRFMSGGRIQDCSVRCCFCHTKIAQCLISGSVPLLKSFFWFS